MGDAPAALAPESVVPSSPASALLTLRLTPHGRLELAPTDEGPPLAADLAARLTEAFARGTGEGLLQLGAAEVGVAVPPVFGWWREFAARFVTALCGRAGEGTPPPPDALQLATLASAAPIMPGAEYVDASSLRGLWAALAAAFEAARAAGGFSAAELLTKLNPAWNVVGRVHLNLAENRQDEDRPFAFVATYTHALSAQGKAQHFRLGQALQEYAGASNRAGLLSLLLPVQKASERCAWLKRLVDSGELFHPMRFTAGEALELLRDVPELEQAGVVVRLPAAWKAGRPSRPQVTGTVGAAPPSSLGLGALLDFRSEVTLDGEPLTKEEVKALLAGVSGLALLRGRWVEVDRERLQRSMARFSEAERLAKQGGLSFAEAMRLLAGAAVTQDEPAAGADPSWSGVVAGPWLEATLRALRSPEAAQDSDPGAELHGTLRPYQAAGVRWLHLLTRLGLGACLADDMGLGKTVQVLSLLLLLRREKGRTQKPSLLVAPASLLGNWSAELERFAPSLRSFVAHPSSASRAELERPKLDGLDLVITSYGTTLRLPWLQTNEWRLLVLDEAQAIKNSGARQTRAVKQLKAGSRVALTGTPVENRLGDLWSLFEFLNPGLLGSAKDFTGYTKRLAKEDHASYGPLRELLKPYLLRRMKTDKSVIADLPEKTEVKAFCHLGRRQAALYEETVEALRKQLEAADGMKRRGLVLASLVRLKQICNHPSQWLGDGAWAEAESGKWMRLRELCEPIAERQEKALFFTQFRELTEPLAAFLGGLFGRPGLVLHGETAVKQRRALVTRFQEDEAVPFFVLSLKAGGSGLNLTAASHVVHVDRWWNPAVEAQATDRAFRIGQKRNVLVHKLVCRGSVEEKIDALLEDKKRLSESLLSGGAELNLTELRDDELLRLVSLDLHAARKE